MIHQKESKKVSMDSWLLKLLSTDMETKAINKDQPTNNHKKQHRRKRVKPCFFVTFTMQVTSFLKISLKFLQSFRRYKDFLRQCYFHQLFGFFDISLLQRN